MNKRSDGSNDRNLIALKRQLGSLNFVTESAFNFLCAYLKEGKHQKELIDALTPYNEQMLFFLFDQEPDEQRRKEYVDVALKNLSIDRRYFEEENIYGEGAYYGLDGNENAEEEVEVFQQYFQDHIHEFDALVAHPEAADNLTPDQARAFVISWQNNGNDLGEIVNLSGFFDTVQKAFVKYGLYEYNRHNLLIALGNEDFIPSLNQLVDKYDDIENDDETSISYKTLENLNAYLNDVLEDGEYSLDTNNDAELLNILKIIETHVDDSYKISTLDEILKKSSPDVIAEAIGTQLSSGGNGLDEMTWHRFAPALFRTKRVKPTFMNIEVCANEYPEKGLDTPFDSKDPVPLIAAVVDFLKDRKACYAITNVDDVSEDRQLKLAAQIINIPSFPLSRKIELVKSSWEGALSLQNYLKPEDVDLSALDKTDEYGRLMVSGIIADDGETWQRLPSDVDWSVKSEFIKRSKGFSTYIDEKTNSGIVLGQDDACHVLVDSSISDLQLKKKIWEQGDLFLSNVAFDNLYQAYLVSMPTNEDLGLPSPDILRRLREHEYTYERLVELHEAGINNAFLVDFLVSSLNNLSYKEIIKVLRSCGGPMAGSYDYSILTTPSKKLKIELDDTPQNQAILEYFLYLKPERIQLLEPITHKNGKLCTKRRAIGVWNKLQRNS
ncbi:hypothetical protein [Bifidobacterium sp. ESL0732]|uniref:hypothetical protein n=1 Tax=Bifidobacterium sp. ESL0732 TaxID=2983222 RepID=UPI0023F78BC3|nr:hypothetical protein [Bifidobacterium sp. ESL0732]WEV64687.1 hypothetical protein OZX70_03730 [Bifidobacterium sp. ESL0732]